MHGRGLSGTALRTWLERRIPRQIRIGFLIEQLPSPHNRVTLDRRTDGLGLPRPHIHYDVDDYTRRGMAAASSTASQAFALLGASEATTYEPTDPGYVTLDGAGYTYHGSGHAVGTHRMGDRPARPRWSTTASAARTTRTSTWSGWGSAPTIATSNPTLTLAALAFRTADALLEDL